MGAPDSLRRWYGAHTPTLLGAAWEYAVLCPLLETPEGWALLFEKRAVALSQGGETCFPGGRMEAGETPEDCALRETREELSIPPEEIQLLGQGDFLCNQRGFLLHPVVGTVTPRGMAALRPSPAEVAEVFTVPVEFFRSTPPDIYTYDLLPSIPADFPYEAVGISREYPWNRGQVEVPVWVYRGRVIWGMTGRLVADLVSHL